MCEQSNSAPVTKSTNGFPTLYVPSAILGTQTKILAPWRIFSVGETENKKDE